MDDVKLYEVNMFVHLTHDRYTTSKLHPILKSLHPSTANGNKQRICID